MSDHQGYISEKIKEANEKGHAWVSCAGHRCKIEPVPAHRSLHGCSFDALINNRGKIVLKTLVTKDAYPRFRFYNGPSAYCAYNQIMAIVTEKHDAKNH